MLLAAILTEGCDHKELDFNTRVAVSIRYNWSECPDASPASMRLMAFDGSSQAFPYPSSGSEGVTLYLPPRIFDFIAYNSDTDVLQHSGTQFNQFTISCMPTTLESTSRMFAFTRSAPRAAGTEEDLTIYEPDRLWYAAKDGADILGGAHAYTLRMAEATHTYTFIINNVENLGYARDILMTISGVSGGFYPATKTCTDTHCIVPFTATTDGSTTITATVRLFGHCPQNVSAEETPQHTHMLVVYAELSDGSKWYYTIDVTNSMHDIDHLVTGDTGHTDTPIVLHDLPLPIPITNGSGLHPSVDEWQEMEYVIPM